jgi:hypothetical protein
MDALFISFRLQTRNVFRHATPVKIDSNAGATGTSVAQLPGRHFIVPPWLALVVWSFILIFIGVRPVTFYLEMSLKEAHAMIFFNCCPSCAPS